MEDIIELKRENLRKERYKFLHAYESNMEIPMIGFSIAWTLLLPISILSGNTISIVFFFILWAIIMTDFLIRVSVAPFRINYLKGNLLLIVSVYIPIIRVGRIVYLLRNEKVNHEYYKTVRLRNKKRWIE